MTTMAHPAATRVTVGVDTHGDVHVAHANDQLGRRLDTVSVPTTPRRPLNRRRFSLSAVTKPQVRALRIRSKADYSGAS